MASDAAVDDEAENADGGFGPFGLPGDDRWRWKAWGRVVDGSFWPWRFEIRYKASSCWHDTPPDGWHVYAEDATGPLAASSGDSGVGWNRRPCRCWASLTSPATEAMPVGGLTARKLRTLNLDDARQLAVEVARNERQWGLDAHHPEWVDAVLSLDDAISTNVASRGTAGPGRRPMPLQERLRRLSVYSDELDKGAGQHKAAARLGITVESLRDTLRWARREGLWQRTTRGEVGALTPEGAGLVDQWRQANTKTKGKP